MRLFLWHQFFSHNDEIRNGHGINFDAIDEKWLHFGAKTKKFQRGLIFRLFRCLPSEGNFEKALNNLGLFIIYQLKRKNFEKQRENPKKIRQRESEGRFTGSPCGP